MSDSIAASQSAIPSSSTSSGTLAHATPASAPEVPGRREFFKYRDLLVAQATDGRMRAQVMSSSRGLSKPTGWHYHACEAQFVYGLKGWSISNSRTAARSACRPVNRFSSREA